MQNIKKVFMLHNGCLNLNYDYKIARDGLKQSGYEIVKDHLMADMVIFAGCGVRKYWVDDAIIQLKSFLKNSKISKIIISGCLSNIDTDYMRKALSEYSVDFLSFSDILSKYSDKDFNQLDGVIEQRMEPGKISDMIERRKLTPEMNKATDFLAEIDSKYDTSLLKLYKENTKGYIFYKEDEQLEYITVTRGCLYKCSFCVIPKGRGPYSSVPLKDLLKKIEKSVSDGITKFVLIGDEIGNYGVDLKDVSFSDLIDNVLAIDTQIKIAIRYIEPGPFLKYYDKIKEHCLNGRIYLIHLPLQTASPVILKKMNRNYDIKKVAAKYKELRLTTPTIFYSNWMVGFPNETAEDLLLTEKLIEDLDIQLNTVLPYSDREGTKAYTMKGKLSQEVKEERCLQLENLFIELRQKRFSQHMSNLNIKTRSLALKLIGEADESNMESYFDGKNVF